MYSITDIMRFSWDELSCKDQQWKKACLEIIDVKDKAKGHLGHSVFFSFYPNTIHSIVSWKYQYTKKSG